MLRLLWMFAYLAVARLDPQSFSLPSAQGATVTLDGFSDFCFSFITLCAVGYGDIAPLSKVARMPAVLEATIGLFYMAVLTSRLVSVYSSAQPQDQQPAGMRAGSSRHPDLTDDETAQDGDK